jgi:hypothetical protein
VSGYLRPRLTDEQAGLLELLIEQELCRNGIRTLEMSMLSRALRAFDDAREKRAQRREELRTVRDVTPEPIRPNANGCLVEAFTPDDKWGEFGWHCLSHAIESETTAWRTVDDAIREGERQCSIVRGWPW